MLSLFSHMSTTLAYSRWKTRVNECTNIIRMGKRIAHLCDVILAVLLELFGGILKSFENLFSSTKPHFLLVFNIFILFFILFLKLRSSTWYFVEHDRILKINQ